MELPIDAATSLVALRLLTSTKPAILSLRGHETGAAGLGYRKDHTLQPGTPGPSPEEVPNKLWGTTHPEN